MISLSFYSTLLRCPLADSWCWLGKGLSSWILWLRGEGWVDRNVALSSGRAAGSSILSQVRANPTCEGTIAHGLALDYCSSY